MKDSRKNLAALVASSLVGRLGILIGGWVKDGFVGEEGFCDQTLITSGEQDPGSISRLQKVCSCSVGYKTAPFTQYKSLPVSIFSTKILAVHNSNVSVHRIGQMRSKSVRGVGILHMRVSAR